MADTISLQAIFNFNQLFMLAISATIFHRLRYSHPGGKFLNCLYNFYFILFKIENVSIDLFFLILVITISNFISAWRQLNYIIL